jgi:hypothetical protein
MKGKERGREKREREREREDRDASGLHTQRGPQCEQQCCDSNHKDTKRRRKDFKRTAAFSVKLFSR